MIIDLARSRQTATSDWINIKSGFILLFSMFFTLISNKFSKLTTILCTAIILSCILTFLCGMCYQGIRGDSKLAFGKKDIATDAITSLPSSPKFESDESTDSREVAAMVKFISQEIIDKSSGGVADPNKLAYQIVSESLIADEDPFFVTALILAESTFRSKARSHVGARGLMQIMPATGEYIAKKINYDYKGTSSLEDPETNLRLGISYVQYLKTMFNDNLDEVLVAYNWGPTNVRKRRSPPSSSVKYSNKIQNYRREWRNDYTNNFHRYRYASIAKLIS